MASVDIYTRQLCGYCAVAKRLLAEKGVDYKEHDATFDPGLRKEMIQRTNGASTFPQIFIDDVHIGGCTELQTLERQGKLDNLLNGDRAS